MPSKSFMSLDRRRDANESGLCHGLKDTLSSKMQFCCPAGQKQINGCCGAWVSSHAPRRKSHQGSPALGGSSVEKDAADVSFGAGGADVMDGWKRGNTCVSSHHLCLRVGGRQHQ